MKEKEEETREREVRREDDEIISVSRVGVLRAGFGSPLTLEAASKNSKIYQSQRVDKFMM